MLTDHLLPEKPDPLLAVARTAALDTRGGKLDLTVGVYRDDAGRTPVMQAVKQAEARLLETQPSKAYLGVGGNEAFVAGIADLLGLAPRGGAGAGAGSWQGDDWCGLQTPGGTGALRLAAELLAKGKAGRTVWLPQPCWTNHPHVLTHAGLSVRPFQAWDGATNRADFAAMLAAIDEARAGDVFLLQPLCQNPTGADLSAEQLVELASALERAGVIPLLDIAYHGFGAGIEAEQAVLEPFTQGVPEVLIAYSCSKNFGLYRERVGALLVRANGAAARELAQGALLSLARASYSMPPDHGAACVATILGDGELNATWRRELAAMKARLDTVRTALAGMGAVGRYDLSVLARSRGMFCQLDLPIEVIRAARERHGIYMADTGRINLAALPEARVETLVAALRELAECRVPA